MEPPVEPPDHPHTEREAALMMELAAEKRENAKLREGLITITAERDRLSRQIDHAARNY